MLNVEDFEYYDEVKLPKLVLAIECYPYMFKKEGVDAYNFTQERDWKMVAHQTAGIACHQRYMYATELTPKSSAIRRNMKKLNKYWLNSCAAIVTGKLFSNLSLE